MHYFAQCCRRKIISTYWMMHITADVQTGEEQESTIQIDCYKYRKWLCLLHKESLQAFTLFGSGRVKKCYY